MDNNQTPSSLSNFISRLRGTKTFLALLLLALAAAVVLIYSSGMFSIKNNLSAATVSDSFVNELLHEQDVTVMIQKAKSAGLVVESHVGDTGSSNLIKDPATGEVLLRERTEEIKIFGAETAEAKIVPSDYGIPLACEFKPGANVYFDEKGEFDGIRNSNNSVHVTRPAGIDNATFDKVMAAINNAVNSINGQLNSYGAGASNVPRFSAPSTSVTGNMDIALVNASNADWGARTSYRSTGGGTSAEYTEMQVNVAGTNEVMTDTSAFNTAMIHEFLHAMGLDHVSSGINVMNPQLRRGDNLTITREQIEALIAAHDPSSNINLSKCAPAHDKLISANLNSCPADIVFVRTLGYYYGLDNRWVEVFNPTVDLYKRVVDKLSGTHSKFSVIDAQYAMLFYPNGYHLADGDIELSLTEDATQVKSVLDRRDALSARIVYDSADRREKEAALKNGTSYMSLSILGAGSKSSPNIVIDAQSFNQDFSYYFQSDGQYILGYDETNENLVYMDQEGYVKGRDVLTDGARFLIAQSPDLRIGSPASPGYSDGIERVYTDRDLNILVDAIQATASKSYAQSAKSVTVSNVSINTNTTNEVTADGVATYTITVSATEPVGMDTIDRVGAMINREGPNAGALRGYLAWSKEGAPFSNGKDQKSCAGGGSASINPGYGASYLTLVSCSVTGTTGGKTASFTVRFDPTFKTPLENNTISGTASNCAAGTGWKSGFAKGIFNLSGDKIPPTIQSTTNSGTQNYNPGVMSLSTSVTDNVGIGSISFTVSKPDGTVIATLPGVSTRAPIYSAPWDPMKLNGLGTYNVTVTATDKAGNKATSNKIVISVVDNTGPSSVVLTPSPNAIVTTMTSVPITTNSVDNIRTTKVEIYIDNALRNTCNASVVTTTMACSYDWSMTGVAAGKHTIQTKTYDTNTPTVNIGTSPVVNVTK